MATSRGGVSARGGSSPVVATIDWPVGAMSGVTREAGLGARLRDAEDRVLLGRPPRQAQHACHAVRLIRQPRQRQRPPPKTRLVARAQDGCDGLGVHGPTRRATHTGTRLPAIGPGQKALPARRWASHGLPSRPRFAAGWAAISRPLHPVRGGWRNDCRVGTRPMQRHALERDGWPRGRRRVRALRGRRGPWKEPVCTAWRRGRGVAAFDPPGLCGTCPRRPHAEGGRRAVCGHTSWTVRGGRGGTPGPRSPAPLPDPTT
jgi:hypothetical protein